jgi:osmoprotectant transport system permease protein
MIAQLLEDRDIEVVRNLGLGGTMICFQALLNGEIHVYPEYSGTIEQAIFRLDRRVGFEELKQQLADSSNLILGTGFGFNNTYALAANRKVAEHRGLKSISDLGRYRDLKYGLSYEYIERGDGWHALARHYNISGDVTGMEHGLAYSAIAEGRIDIMDVYSTDAEIIKYDLVVLEDDLNFFPKYFAAPLWRSDVADSVRNIISPLGAQIDEETMQQLNAEVAVEGRSFAETAHDFLVDNELITPRSQPAGTGRWAELGGRTLTHIYLTGISLLAAVFTAVPVGIVVYRLERIAKPLIYVAGLLQTIPSLALLALMIPVFGIGVKPTIVALYLYALLPILRNTYTALAGIEPIYKKVATAMGFAVSQRLRLIELPLAIPGILAGVRTSAVILIGTATIAAFIGAGGLGEYIVTGLALNDPELIMWGAIPAALLAIVVELLFESLERLVIPAHLRQRFN